MLINFRFKSLLGCCLAIFIFGCTPKAAGPATTSTKKTTTTATKPAKPGEQLSECDKFTDTRNPDQAETDYVIYRQLVKAKDMTEGMKQWRKVYANSPAADGRRSTVFVDGIAFYNDLILKNPDNKEAYGDTLLTIYSKARECYPGDGYMAAMQAFDSYYTYPGSATDEQIYELFKESIELDGQEKMQYFVINPMSGLIVKMHREGNITDAEAKPLVEALLFRLEKGLEECQGANCEPWKLIENYTPDALAYFETVEGFYDCQYYTDKYYTAFKANPDDCDAITAAFGRMRFGGCTDEMAEYAEVKAAYAANCRPDIATSGGSAPSGSWQAKVRAAYEAYQNGKPQQAVKLFEEAMPEVPAEKKSAYQLLTAKIYYRDLRSYSAARSWARQAAASDPSSGEPYMLIGTLYASSGPLCGTGTGFNSQVVTWPAIDMWQKAKSIDSSVSGKANSLINRYTQYMPSKADVFQRGLSEGGTYTVGCWINETTRIRTP